MDFNFRAVTAFIDLERTQKNHAQYATTTAILFLSSGRQTQVAHQTNNTSLIGRQSAKLQTEGLGVPGRHLRWTS